MRSTTERTSRRYGPLKISRRSSCGALFFVPDRLPARRRKISKKEYSET